MERLIDFLNHGILPFTGRTAVIGRIVSFWRGTLDAEELRSALLIGEAGIGKSRLLAAVAAAVADAGGAVIHVRLVPESPTSLLPLLAKGLMYSELARRLLNSEPEPTCAAVAAALRRVAQLRPTLLVLEDLHLISDDALRELAMLLEAIADETLSLLCLARPAELAARAVIHRSLVEEIELTGLSDVEVAELWRALFEAEPEAGAAGRLVEATGGNPLAIRSAIRSAIGSGAILVDQSPGRRQVRIHAAAFDRTLRRSVDLLVEGMTAHLTAPEREAAARLATLGELFDPESAAALLPEPARMLAMLTFKGIIAPGYASRPLAGEPVESPYTFTHTLLHQELVGSGTAPVAALISVIARGLPVYSTLPFRLVARRDLLILPDPAEAVRFVRCAIDVSYRLDAGPDWKLTAEILCAGRRIFEALRGRVDREQERELEAELLHRTLASLRSPEDEEAFENHLRQLLALTAEQSSGPMLIYRLRALHHLHVVRARSRYEACGEIWLRVEELIESAPELEASEAYINFLEEVANAAKRLPDPAMLRRVEARVTRLMSRPDLSGELRDLARRMVVPMLLTLFDTEEELARRLALLPELAGHIDGRNAALELGRITLLETIGRMEEALEAAVHAATRFRQIGLPRNAAHAELIALAARAALGADLEAIAREAVDLGAPPPASPALRRNIGIYLTEIGLLRGELDWTRSLDDRIDGTGLSFWPEGKLLAARDRTDVAGAIDDLSEDEEPQRLLKTLCAQLLEGMDDCAAAETLRSILRRPLLRLDDLLLLEATLAVLDAPGAASLRQSMREEIRWTAMEAFAWLAGRGLHPMIGPLLDRAGHYLRKRERGHWRAEARALAAKLAGTVAAPSPMRIVMLGSISYSDETGRLRPLRGARLRTVLGLLVAARMTREPLSPIEFSVIAAGSEAEDIEHARKTAVMAVRRLREVIGSEAIVTGEPMYVLDVGHVTVDLLEAHRLIREARAALRRRALLKAFPALRGALLISRGDVPFPGLYDEFFEAIRNDFEHALRSCVLDVARALIGEADTASAGELLALAHRGMPEDEEIGELLRRTLVADGSSAEAERIRIRSSEIFEEAGRD
jgi:hypothetical protein